MNTLEFESLRRTIKTNKTGGFARVDGKDGCRGLLLLNTLVNL